MKKKNEYRGRKMAREGNYDTRSYNKGYEDAIAHAEWMITTDGIRCSKCRIVFTLFNIRSNYYNMEAKKSLLTNELLTIRKIYKYCPECGAKMDINPIKKMKLIDKQEEEDI